VRRIALILVCLTAGCLHLFGQIIITNSPPNGTFGQAYSFQFTQTGGSSGQNWAWVGDDSFQPFTGTPQGLNLSTSGLISGTPTQAGTYHITVTVSDSKSNFGSSNFTIIIAATCYPTILTSGTLVAGDVGVPYSQAINVSGCKTPYSFTATISNPVSTTILPPGLTIGPGPSGLSGLISGTPTATGTYQFNINVTEAGGGMTTGTYSITINPALSIGAASPLPSALAGVPYSQSLLPTGGSQPYFSFTLDTPPPGLTLDSPSGLLHGTPPASAISSTPYSFTATLTDNIAAQVKKTFQISIVAAPQLLQVSPTSLTFSGVTGGDPPANQALSLAPTAAATGPVTFRVLTDAGQLNTKPPFTLTVKPTTGTAPAQLVVSVDQTGIQGNASARIRILDQNNTETDIPVNLNVTTVSSQLQVTPSSLRFAATTQAPGTFEQDLAITSTGGGGPIGFSASVLNGSSWISSVTPASGQTVRNSAVYIRVLVNTQGQQVGSYRDTIHITYPGGSVDVPVALFIRSGGPAIGVNVSGLRYQAQQGGGFSNSQTIKILNVGDPSSTVNWTAKIVSGADVVSLGATTGTATATKPGLLPINLAPGATQLSVGGHYAVISITDNNAQNSPANVTIVLDLSASGSPALPDPNPAGLFFVVAAAGSPSALQTVTVNTSSAKAVSFNVASTTADGGSWLNVNPATGQTSGQTAGTFSVAVNPLAMTAGIYSGQVSVSISGVVRTVNITVIVLPAGSTLPVSSSIRPEALEQEAAAVAPRATCTPTKLALTETGLVNNFSVPAKWPATLIVQLNDDCANAVGNGAVVANFSNGDAPVSLRGNGQSSTYSATWQPGTTSSQMAVTLNATSGTLTPATMQLVGGVAANPGSAPVLFAGGTVNAFFRSSPALTPGTVVEVYGSGLASSATGTTVPPLPTTFNGTSVLVGGIAAPLFYLSDGQLDVQIPSELAPNQSYPILVSANGAITVPDQIDVSFKPTVDVLPDGHIVAQHGADSSLVTTSSPAKPGEALVIYLLGMGSTNPSVPSGAPAPSDPLAQVTAQPTITVDNKPATVFFAGLTPGFAGLYQIDFFVPKDSRSGDLPVVITQNGITTNATTLPVSQ